MTTATTVTKMPKIDWCKNIIQRRIGTEILWEYLITYIGAFHCFLDEKVEQADWDWSQVDDQVCKNAVAVFNLMRGLKMSFEIINEDGDPELKPGFLEFMEGKKLAKEYNENRHIWDDLDLNYAAMPVLLNSSDCAVQGRLVFRAMTLFRMMAEVLVKGLSEETGNYIDIDKRHNTGHFDLMGQELLKLLCDLLGDEYPSQLVLSPD